MNEVITLENINTRTIYQVFEDAFSDYFVKFENKYEVHLERWLSAGVDFALSYGVKTDGKLVAFLLHAPRGDMVMNLATGVCRNFHGRGYTGLMYERIKQDLPAKGFRRGQLEVITLNTKAIRAYKKAGFKTRRKLLSWKGNFTTLKECRGDYDIKKPILTDEHAQLRLCEPAFEQVDAVVARRASMLELHELRRENKLVAYAVWNPWRMNLVQLSGVDSESIEGLLLRMKLSGEHVGMINVDENDSHVNQLFKRSGLENYLSQNEMETFF